MQAVRSAPADSGVLILAPGYPERQTVIPADVFTLAAAEHLGKGGRVLSAR